MNEWILRKEQRSVIYGFNFYFVIYDFNFYFVEQSIFVCENGESLPEEFVETAYYKDLNSVDRLHHRVSIFWLFFSPFSFVEIG